MLQPITILFALFAISIALVALVVVRPGLTATRGGKVLAFVSFFIFPVMAGVLGTGEHLEHSKRTEFCLSCHVMADHGKSLYLDDADAVAARHFQNNLVPRDKACYTCHTDYVLFGDVQTKLRGLRHVYVNYIGTPAKPLRLYSPYNNRECLHCHLGARSFEEGAVHNADPDTLPAVKANQVSCMTEGCHSTVHNIEALDEATFWEPAP